jgi:hypothetical protein
MKQDLTVYVVMLTETLESVTQNISQILVNMNHGEDICN